MKVLLVTQDFPPRPGGMSRYYADLVRGLGPECVVAAGSWGGESPSPQGGGTLSILPFDASGSHRPWNLFRTRRELDRLITRTGPTVLLCGNIRPFGPLCLGLAARHEIPMVQAYHGNDLLRTARRWKGHPIKNRRWKRLVESSDRHVVNSAYTAGLAQDLGLPRERIAVVPPEVDTDRFRPCATATERESLRREFGWEEDACIALFVGRLVARKGLLDLFAALRELPASVRLIAVGPGDTAHWQAASREHGVESRVTFLGMATEADLPRLYRAADLFVGPSRDREEEDDVEGFGIVFLEASASGLPILATRAGGIPEAVEEGVSGILVSPENTAALAEAWGRLVRDAGLRLDLGSGGREGRARRHGPGTSAMRFREVIEAPAAGQFRV